MEHPPIIINYIDDFPMHSIYSQPWPSLMTEGLVDVSGSHGHPRLNDHPSSVKALFLLRHAGEFQPPSPGRLKHKGTWPAANLLKLGPVVSDGFGVAWNKKRETRLLLMFLFNTFNIF